jgi:transposase
VPDTVVGEGQVAELVQRVAALEAERDEYKRLYVALMEAYRKLEAGLVGPKRERFIEGDQEQLTLAVLSMLLKQGVPPPPPPMQEVSAHTRAKPTGRKPLPDSLPRIDIEVVPLEVQKKGLEAFERIGEETSETVERRPASLVVVRVVRGKFVEKAAGPVSAEATEQPAVAARSQTPSSETTSPLAPVGASGVALTVVRPAEPGPVLQAPAMELPIPRALAGPGLLADTIVRRWQDHMPLHRMERMYGREGLFLARSTVCGWHQEVAALAEPLVAAMWKDALTSPYLLSDATGVLVQALEKCRRGHFFVVVAPPKHVLFGYSPTHDSAAVDKILGTFKGYLVADAHSVYDHLFKKGDVVECACWCHARRYWWKALESDSARAKHALSLIQVLFRIERECATSPPEEKLRRRQKDSKPVIDAFFAWCDEEALKVLDETPISKAIGYAQNQRVALSRFLEDGRLPIHNNGSENALRREALGRRNWLFVGNDEGGEVNATLVTLLASCQMHGLEPLGYLRDLLCLLPAWPAHSVLDLSPAHWMATSARDEVKHRLDENVFRRASLGLIKPTEGKRT